MVFVTSCLLGQNFHNNCSVTDNTYYKRKRVSKYDCPINVTKSTYCNHFLHKKRILAFSRRSRATTGKQMYKKAWCTCKVVVSLIKSIAFLPFLLLSPSFLLKLSINCTPSWRLAGHLGKTGRREGEREENLYFFLLLIPFASSTHFPCYLGVAQIE